MPVMDGIEATREIVAADLGKVVILTTFDRDDYVFDGLRAGASGFLLKDAQRHELVSAIRAVHRGDATLSHRVTRRLMELVGHTPPPSDQPDPTAVLTERERDVFLDMGRGRSNAEIAAHFVLSETTVKTHVGRVLAKLGCRDRVQAVVLAYRLGVVAPD